jgi:hypothetical protein
MCNDNYWQAFILNNKLLTRGRRDIELLNKHFFGCVNDMGRLCKIAKVKFCDCFSNRMFPLA